MDTSKITEIVDKCATFMETADEERLIGRTMILAKAVQDAQEGKTDHLENTVAMLELACILFLKGQEDGN